MRRKRGATDPRRRRGPLLVALLAGLAGCGALAAPGNPDAVAVVIGVKEYAGGIPPADYALFDAAAVQRFLVRHLGYRTGNVIYRENPTKGQLEAIFGGPGDPQGKLHAYHKPGKSDVFVYYSGHGASDEATGEAYLLPSDAEPGRPGLTGYPLELLKRNLAALEAASLTVVIEACFSGLSEAGRVVAEGNPAGWEWSWPFGEGPGAYLTSSSGREVSAWYPPVSHSLFTFFLLKGLHGAADRGPADGRVTAREVETYVAEEVPYWARRLRGSPQTPQVGFTDAERVLSRPDEEMRAWLARMEADEERMRKGAAAGPAGAPAGRRPVPGVGALYIDSEPEGARVYLDAEPQGETPVELSGVAAGERQLTLVLAGHAPLTKVVEVEAGSREIVREVLARQTGTLKVEPQPAGASVYLDGRYVGAAPQELKMVPAGTHALRLEHPDHETLETEVQVEFGGETRVAPELAPRPGRLLVVAAPEGASVRVDGEEVGEAPWSGEVPVGSRRVEVAAKGYRTERREVTVEANRAQTLTVALERGEEAGPAPSGMVLVPAGEFWMGAAAGDAAAEQDEKPGRRVYLDAFLIDRTEVTNARYREFLREVGSAGHRGCDASEPAGKDHSPKDYGDDFSGGDHPVVGVDWYDAHAFCAWAGKRLPTEAEWEKAARGTDGRLYPWGPEASGAARHGNFADESAKREHPGWTIVEGYDDGFANTAPVGSFPDGASPYGALDMAGNVWEWVQDRYDAGYYAGAPAWNPMGPTGGSTRVLRGGSWSSAPVGLRASLRYHGHPAARHRVGFRCAQDPE